MEGREMDEMQERALFAFVAKYIETTPDLRDQFAMAALTGLLGNVTACAEIRKIDSKNIDGNMATCCFSYADAMIKARSKPNE